MKTGFQCLYRSGRGGVYNVLLRSDRGAERGSCSPQQGAQDARGITPEGYWD